MPSAVPPPAEVGDSVTRGVHPAPCTRVQRRAPKGPAGRPGPAARSSRRPPRARISTLGIEGRGDRQSDDWRYGTTNEWNADKTVNVTPGIKQYTTYHATRTTRHAPRTTRHAPSSCAQCREHCVGGEHPTLPLSEGYVLSHRHVAQPSGNAAFARAELCSLIRGAGHLIFVGRSCRKPPLPENKTRHAACNAPRATLPAAAELAARIGALKSVERPPLKLFNANGLALVQQQCERCSNNANDAAIMRTTQEQCEGCSNNSTFLPQHDEPRMHHTTRETHTMQGSRAPGARCLGHSTPPIQHARTSARTQTHATTRTHS